MTARTALALSAVTCLWLASGTIAGAFKPTPPPGFVALYNGKDLEGWRGGDTQDHRKYLAMDPAARAKQDAEWTADMLKHWSVQNGELVNDGHGRYATTIEDYGDFELLVEYKTVPLADSGIYLRNVPQVQIWDPANAKEKKNGADKGSGALWTFLRDLEGMDWDGFSVRA